MPLDPAQASRVYDKVGRFQDTQSFYEGPAVARMLDDGAFDHAHAVFEVGCGTGAMAARLLRDRLPTDATYHGVDVSPRMVSIASGRLRAWPQRATVERTDGQPPFDRADGSADRVVAAYVLDLLTEEDAAALIAEAHRLLEPGGLLCLTSITHGRAPASRTVSRIWEATARRLPVLTGGCRPIELDRLLAADDWEVVTDRRVTAWLVTSQVLVARSR